MPSPSRSRMGRWRGWRWCLLACLALGVGAPAQGALDPGRSLSQYGHESWNREQGLPQNSVWAIAQTPDGYLWFGTEEGLVRYDGVAFKVFDKGNTPVLRNNSINALLVDRQGTLWVGTNSAGGGGLYHLTPTGFEFVSQKQAARGPNITCLLEDREGSLWEGSWTGLHRLAKGVWSAFRVSDGLPSERITAVCQDRSGRLFAGTSRGLALYRDGRFIPIHPERLAGEFVKALVEDREGGILIATFSGKLWRYQADRLERLEIPGVQPEGIHQLYLDRGGTLWIGSRGRGLLRRRPEGLEAFDHREGLAEDEVLSLFEDREGSLWIGTRTGGLHRLRDTPLATFSSREGLSTGSVTALLQARDGSLWIGTDGNGGVNRIRDGRVTLIGKREGLTSDGIRSLAEGPGGELWIGTDSGLNRWKDGKVQRFTQAQGLAHDYILSLLAEPDGSLWIGTALGGLSRMEHGRFSDYTEKEGLPDLSVLALAKARDGGLWIGTQSGLALLKEGRITVPAPLPGQDPFTVHCLLDGGDGTLWIGTEGDGVKRLKGGALASVTTAQGLFDDTVSQILDDGMGNLWMSCNKGLFRVSRADLDAVADGSRRRLRCRSFDTQDGMRSADCSGGIQPAGWKALDGTLWFPTSDGAVQADPARLAPNTQPPPVVIEAALVDQAPAGDPRKLVVPAGAQSLEICYTALSFLVPKRVQFRYRLEGYDRDWVEAGGRRTAFYTNLPPGRYRFRVLACNNDGVWNEEGASLELKVEPHFYQTLWFYLLCGISAVGFGALIQMHFQRTRIRALKAENRVLDERHRLARNVHDQLSQTMTGLLLQLEAAGHAMSMGEERCRPYLERATALAREGIHETRRTIRGLRASALEDGDLVQAIASIARNLTEGTEVRVEVEQAGQPYALPQEIEDDLFRAGQEGITNALRHGQPRRIEVHLTWEPGGVRLTIRDDGRGLEAPLDPDQPRTGLGLSGMWERIATDRGTLKVGNHPEGGTEVEVFIPKEGGKP